ncbi:MAG: carbohydrate ABC transporter permease [Geminicoccaceae bacterium]
MKLSPRRRGEIARYSLILIWTAFCVLPIIWFLTIGLRPRTEVVVQPPIYWPTFSLESWRDLWQTWPIGFYLRNTALAVFGSVILDLVLAIPAAYALSRFTFRGRDDLGFYILSTRMIVPAAVALPIFALFQTWTLLDTPWALLLVFAAMNLSIVTWIIRSYMMEIPQEIEDAAKTDGAGPLAILLLLIVPLSMPGIMTAATIAMIFAINEFLFTLLIAYTSQAQTMSVGLAMFTGGSHGIIFTNIAILSFLVFVPISIFAYLIQGHLSRGLTMGAVKG